MNMIVEFLILIGEREFYNQKKKKEPTLFASLLFIAFYIIHYLNYLCNDHKIAFAFYIFLKIFLQASNITTNIH